MKALTGPGQDSRFIRGGDILLNCFLSYLWLPVEWSINKHLNWNHRGWIWIAFLSELVAGALPIKHMYRGAYTAPDLELGNGRVSQIETPSGLETNFRPAQTEG